MKLMLEIDIPDDQVPENATGRLSHRNPKKGESFIGVDGGVWLCDGELSIGLDQHRLVIETREPWRVPEHLRHPRYNGWTVVFNFAITVKGGGASSCVVDANGRTTYDGLLLRVSKDDFDGMEPGVVYKLGEQ